MNRRTFLAPLMAITLVSVPMLMPTPAAAQPPSGGGLVTSILQVVPGVGTFAGTLTTTGFTYANGVISAVGNLTGTFTPLGSTVGQTVNQAVTVPLTGFSGTCQILTLHVGAITLNLLGVNVALAPVDLVITATAAPGNLLGNLLCSVAHLLDSGGPLANLLGSLTTLLNQIVGAIRL